MSQDKPTYQQLQQHITQLENSIATLTAQQTDPALSNYQNPQPELKETRTQLHQSEKLAQALLDAVTDISIIVTDPQGLITAFNAGAQELLGYTTQEMVGHQTPMAFLLESEVDQRCQELSRELGRPVDKFEIFMSQARADHVGPRCWTHVRKDGTHLQLRLSMIEITDDDANVAGYLGVGANVTQHKQVATQVKELKQQMEFILGATNTGLDIIDADFNIRYIDPEWAKVYGPTTGKKCYQYFMGRDQVCPGCGIVKALKTKNTAVTEEALVKEKNRPIQVTTIPFQNAQGEWLVAEVNVDITERKQAEQELTDERNFSRSLIETAQVIMLILDSEGKIASFNPYMEDICDYRLDEVKGADWFETFLPKKDQQRVREIFRQAISDIQTRGNVNPIITKDGRLRQIEWHDKALKDTHGNITGLLSVGRDITERITAEAELRQTKKLAEAASQAKTSFLANMSHEIRTPMNAIVGFADVLATEGLTTQQNEYLNIINDAGKNLLSIIDDILDISKIEAGKLDIQIIECSVTDLLHSIDTLLRPKARAKGLDFVISSQPDVPALICTDPLRLSQCLTNLINNAVKFTESGHVHLAVSMATNQDEPLLRFDVQDTGIGIAPDVQDTIFDAFAQADSSTTRKFGGTGLGLAITKQLAIALGGTITLDSQLGAGSCFSLFISPGIELQAQPQPEQSNAHQDIDNVLDPLHPHFTGNVLVAEDNPSNQQLIDILLKQMGLTVTLVDTGRKTIDAATTQSFDLIFMDMQMPDINGYQATRTLRQKGFTVPIVALTAHAMEKDRRLCLSAGCDQHLAKPLSQDRLSEVLSIYLPYAETADSAPLDNSLPQIV